MTIENYITDRVDDQFCYYNKQSNKNKMFFISIMTIQIILASFLPILTNIGSTDVNLFVSIIGVLIVILTSLQSLNKFKENWINFRKTAERLKHEKYVFLCKPTSDQEKTFQEFVNKIELIISVENVKWADFSSKDGGTLRE